MARLILSLALTLLLTAVAPAADDYWEGDRWLECLVGKGVVEIRHGAEVSDALEAADAACESAMEPEPAEGEEPEGDWGDYVDYIYGAAHGALTAIKLGSSF